jgi:arylsulfatase A-like enzyme
MLAVVAFCAAMINYLDDNLANVTGLMKSLGMWENTLMVLSSDK